MQLLHRDHQVAEFDGAARRDAQDVLALPKRLLDAEPRDVLELAVIEGHQGLDDFLVREDEPLRNLDVARGQPLARRHQVFGSSSSSPTVGSPRRCFATATAAARSLRVVAVYAMSGSTRLPKD